MADCYSVLGFWGIMPPAESFGRAKAAAARALELDRDLAEASCSLAYALQHYDQDWAAAEESYKTALRLNPSYPTGHHFFALLCLATGRMRLAVEEMQKAESLDPLSRIIMTAHGLVLFHAREHEPAIRQFRKAIELDPGFWVAREWLGRTLAAIGRFDEAIAECRLAAAAEGSAAMSEASLAYVLARAGQREEARRMFDALLDSSRRRYVMPSLFAVILAGLEEHETALDWLDKAVAERGSQLCYLRVEPAFDRLHDHPRFRAIVEELGLPQAGPASRSGGAA
jgi:tetratricopeptide (TPR) repeat protein